MKRNALIIIITTLSGFTGLLAQNHLTMTDWKGSINIPDPVEVILHFSKDTFLVKTLQSQEVIEIMNYKQSNDTMTITKLSGNSPCGNEIGTYKLELKKGTQLSFSIIKDICNERSQPLANAQSFNKIPLPAKEKKK